MSAPPNDSPDYATRRQQILDGALQVFGSKGFHKATNKDIAQAAGISPGLIYWYFRDKQDLFLSLLHDRLPVFALIQHPERLLPLPPQQALTLLGRAVLATFAEPANAAMFKIIIGEAARFPQLGELIAARGPGQIFALLDTYLAQQVAAGTLRQHDTGIAARSFVGMLISHVMMREVLRLPAAQQSSDEAVLAQAVETTLRGLAA